MAKTVFCEGIYDFELLRYLKKNENLANIVIQATGGKTNMKHFVQARATINSVLQNQFFIIRDRDFDFSNTLHDELYQNLNKVVAGKVSSQKTEIWTEKTEQQPIQNQTVAYQEFVLKRICIENYFLDFNDLVLFNDDKVKELNSLQNCKAIFDQAATDLIHYAAIRHSLGLCKKNIWTDIRLATSLAKNKQLPKNLDTNTLIQAVENAINTYKMQVDKKVLFKDFYTKYLHFLSLFENPTFIQGNHYLEFFSASDLQNQVETLLIKQQTGFSFAKFYEYQIQKFDYNTFPDWVEFVNELRS